MISPILVGVLGIGCTLALLVVRVPIAVGLGLMSLVGIWYLGGTDALVMSAGELTYEFVASWELSAIPLFIFMGAICANTGLVSGIYRAARLWLDWCPGGIAVATNFASAGFAAASGSSLATAASMSKMAIPEMLRAGYQPALAAGVVAASGTLGSLIPPSILMVVFGLIAEESIKDLLLAGIIPGLLTAVIYAALIIIRCMVTPSLVSGKTVRLKPTARELLRVTLDIWPLPVLIVVVIGAMYSGLATATEAAAIGCSGALVLSIVTRSLTWPTFRSSIVETLRTTGMIFFIVLGAVLFTRFLAYTGLPGAIASVAQGVTEHWVLLLVISVVYVILGMFLDSLGIMLLTVPIFMPIIHAAGYSPIWFGVIVVKFIEIGLLTPPVGMNAFVVKSAVGDLMSLGTIFRGILWFLAAEVVIMLLLMNFPVLSTIIPDLARG